MKTSQNGINLIKKFEGCRLTAYRCAAGVPTIGYGHTAGVKIGQSITQEQAEQYLRDDLEKFERMVMKYDARYHWNQNQFDALVSFAYNIGSIDQLTANGTRNTQTISQKILQYNRAAGKVLDGLNKRRKEEQKLFSSTSMPNIQASSVDVGHVQLNYQPGRMYTVAVDSLRVRTKKAFQSALMLPNAEIVGAVKMGKKVKNHATARVGDQIWMFIGLNNRGQEKWVCADTGTKAYIK